jgi:hypothetical protein
MTRIESMFGFIIDPHICTGEPFVSDGCGHGGWPTHFDAGHWHSGDKKGAE